MWKQALCEWSYRYKELLCHKEYTTNTIHISTFEDIKKQKMHRIPCQPSLTPT